MEVTIEKLDHKGRGISHIDGKIVFIDDALVGEVVDIEIDKRTSKYMEAHILKYLTTSNERVKSKCPYYRDCGGCHLRHMSYEDTLKFKKEKVIDIFKKYADFDVDPIVIKNKDKDFYRNKVELKVSNRVSGFYKKRSHDIVEVDRCINAMESINTILRSLNLLNVNNGSVTVKSNYNDEIILDIITEEPINVDIDKLRDRCKLVGIIVNNRLIYGADHFIEIIDDQFFKETYNSFFQINRYINEQLFKIIEENISEGATVVDMCCGVGTLGIISSKKARKVYSLEINENAIKDGLVNAKMNKANNISFLLGDAYQNISKIDDSIDIYIIDPPRSGLTEEALKTILKQSPKSIIYVSCDPMTLSRDVKVLKKRYDLQKLYILDMFSYTYHVECVCILKLS